eukprot:6188305-Pleurochrysis_carterae.AAC.1
MEQMYGEGCGELLLSFLPEKEPAEHEADDTAVVDEEEATARPHATHAFTCNAKRPPTRPHAHATARPRGRTPTRPHAHDAHAQTHTDGCARTCEREHARASTHLSDRATGLPGEPSPSLLLVAVRRRAQSQLRSFFPRFHIHSHQACTRPRSGAATQGRRAYLHRPGTPIPLLPLFTFTRLDCHASSVRHQR